MSPKLTCKCDKRWHVPEGVEKLTMEEIEVKEYVGCLAKSFERQAA